MVRRFNELTVMSVMAAAVLWSGAASASPGEPPYPRSTLISGLSLDWSTHRRAAQGSDNFQLTWADDDNLYGAWGDGGGFGGTNKKGRVGLGVTGPAPTAGAGTIRTIPSSSAATERVGE
ncbi:MAG: hypothetical protein ACYS7Y_18165 [Planctomycetota bacterium]|jgi:hypothetical protein